MNLEKVANLAKIAKVTDSIFHCNKEDTLSNIARITNLAKVQTYFCINVKKALWKSANFSKIAKVPRIFHCSEKNTLKKTQG